MPRDGWWRKKSKGSVALAEELFQDVWMKLIRARSDEVRAKFSTYLYHLAHHRLIDHYRRQPSGISISYDDAEEPLIEQVADNPMHEPDNELARRRLAQPLLQQLGQLPEAQRGAFSLREESGLSPAQIAEVTGVSAETAKSRLRYALARLRHGLTRK